METEYQVGPQRLSDNARGLGRIGSFGELLTGGMNGFYAEQVQRGNGYAFSTALAGVALIAATTTNNKCLLWNPPDSGRVLSLMQIKFGRTAVGTPLEGSIVYNYAQNMRSFGATGADIVSGTLVAGKNLRTDLADNSKVQWYPAASVLTTAPSLLCCSGIAQTADNGATTVSGPNCNAGVRDDIWGAIQVWPGTLFTIGAAVSIATTYTITIFALSLPIPLHA